ncbi:MAG TPA: DegQ family serine endoprotease [Nitrospirae bacterium]|nr:DegQ family serine endoprotease [Nitrospirota bacterium]
MRKILCFILLFLFLLKTDAYCGTSKDALADLGNAMANISEKAKRSVVNISTTKTVRQQNNPFFDDPFFRRFFGDGGQQKRKVTNLGSGVIVSKDGYILTNNHVIDGAEDIIVRLSGGKEVKGKVVGLDSRTDIAVIKINETDLPAITWGDSDKLRVGQIVLAIGNPFGLSSTITMGIVSALGRSGMGITDYEDFIQTDAAINPGNSGGALVNTSGELVGINTAILSRSGGYQGIGFAIPSNMARNIMDSIINEGKVVRGWLGVQIQALNSELARQFGLRDENGALVVEIVDDSPADKANFKRGDVIVEFEGKKIENPSQLKNLVALTRPGQETTFKIIRDGKPMTIKLEIGELPSDTTKATITPSSILDNAFKGVAVQEVTDEILQKLGITKKIKGVIVNSVEENSPALGIINRGDIIMEINRKAVTGIKDYNEIVSKIEKNKDVLLLILRGKVSTFVTIPAK